MKRFNLMTVCLALIAGAISTAASAETRIALVIGNSQYRHVPSLDNPTSDARMVAETLKGLGFKLVGDDAQFNLDKSNLDTAIRNFGSQMQGADVALFYYAGHGVQVRGVNYLVPINANPNREADVDFELEDVSLVLRQMEAAGTRLNLVTLDACRNNPFGGRGLRSADAGLAQMRAPEGTLISFATQPGNVAQDGFDGHSPYSRALVQTISKPGLGVFDAFNEVGLRVKKSTGGVQQPWVSSSPIDGSFYFAGLPKQDAVALAPLPPAPPQLPVAAPVIEQPAEPAVKTPDAKPLPTTKLPAAKNPKEKKTAMIPPEQPAPSAALKSQDEKTVDRGVAIYNGRYVGTISSGCPHEPGGPVTIRNGQIIGRTLSGTVTADGEVTGRGGALFKARFSGRMHSPSSGSGGWTTSIGCTGSWTMSRR
jgi:hypothetical protein